MTEFMLFSNEPVNTDVIQLKIGQAKLTLTSNFIFLEINFDNKLKFNGHSNSIVSEEAKSKGISYRVRKFLSMEACIKFYYAFVYPYLSYNISKWEILTKIFRNL